MGPLVRCFSPHRSRVLRANSLPPDVIYELDGAPLRVEADRNMTLLGYGDGAIITRGLTSGRHIEVLDARLELCNIRLEGGQARVRICKRPRPRQIVSIW